MRERGEIERICTFYRTGGLSLSAFLNQPALSQVDRVDCERVEWMKGEYKTAESLTITKLLILVISLALSQGFC